MNLREPIRRFLAAALFASLIATACGQPTSPPKETPTPQATPTVTLAPKPTATAIPTATPSPTATPTATPVPPTATPVPPTPTPTPTPRVNIVDLKEYQVEYEGITLTVKIGIDFSLRYRPERKIKTTLLNEEVYGAKAKGRLAEAVLRGHYRAQARENAGVSFAEWLSLVKAVQQGQLATKRLGYYLGGFTDAVLPDKFWIERISPTTIILSNEVGLIKSRLPEPDLGIPGSGVSFYLWSDGSLLVKQTFPLNSIQKTPVGHWFVSSQASGAVAVALSRLGIPIEQQYGGKVIPDAPDEDLDRLLRGDDLRTPLILVVEEP